MLSERESRLISEEVSITISDYLPFWRELLNEVVQPTPPQKSEKSLPADIEAPIEQMEYLLAQARATGRQAHVKVDFEPDGFALRSTVTSMPGTVAYDNHKK